MRNRLLLYSVIGLVTLASLGGVSAYSLFQNLCFPLANGTPCINWTGTGYEWTNITSPGDGNNYPTNLSVNNTGNNFTIQLGRSGLSTLLANFEVNASGGGNTYNYASNITFNNGTSINITGNSTNVTIGIPNLETCSPTTEYSVWNGSHWRCENDNDGTTYTFTNTDTFINITGTPAVNINANLTSFDLRYVLTSIYNAFVSAIYTNTTNLQNANVTTNARIDSLNTTLQIKGNVSGILVSGEGVYAYNNTELRSNKILYVEPGNASDIQAKINQCPSDGCTVIIPSGVYYVNSSIYINKSIILKGQSTISTVLNFNNTQDLSALENNAGTNIAHIGIIDLTINNTAQKNGTGVNMSAMLYADIRNVYVNNFESCFLLPSGNSFYNNLYNPRGTLCGIGIQIDGNQNNVFGGRIHTVNKTHYNITGVGNDLYGSAAETIVSGTIGVYISSSGNYNNIQGFYAEGNSGSSTGYFIDGNGNTLQGYAVVLGNRTIDNGRGNSISISGATAQIGSPESIMNIQTHVTAGGSRIILSPRSNDNAASFVDSFRYTYSNNSEFRIFKGDNTTTTTFRINATDGDILSMGDTIIGELNSDLHIISRGNANNEGVVLEVLGVGEVLRANRNMQTFINGSITINSTSPTQALHVSGGANITTITYTPQLCLNGVCRTVWPLDTYVNVTNLQAVFNYSLDRAAVLGNISSLNATKAGTGAVNCGSGTLLQNLTLSSSGVSGQCYTDQTGGGGVSDGNKGDITVASSGTTWYLNNATVGINKFTASGTPSATTFLRGDNTWATPSGGSTSWTNWTTSRVNSTSSTVWSTIPNLTTTLSANQNYSVDCLFLSYTNLVTTGEQIRVNFTGTIPVNVTLVYNSQVSATTRTSYGGRNTTADNVFADTGSAGTNILDNVILAGHIRTGTSAATINYALKSEISGNNTVVEEGSQCEYKVLT